MKCKHYIACVRSRLLPSLGFMTTLYGNIQGVGLISEKSEENSF